MKNVQNFGAAVAVSAGVVSWAPRVAMPAAAATHPAIATHAAIPAATRRIAAATVASVNRGTT